MRKIKTAELTGAALDWAVAKCEEVNASYLRPDVFKACHRIGNFRYSTSWDQGGPIIECEKIEITAWGQSEWRARSNWNASYSTWVHVTMFETFGPTPLIAAMRCYVALKLGDEVEIPEKLS